MGSERKRGKLAEFNAFLRGGCGDCFSEIIGRAGILDDPGHERGFYPAVTAAFAGLLHERFDLEFLFRRMREDDVVERVRPAVKAEEAMVRIERDIDGRLKARDKATVRFGQAR